MWYGFNKEYISYFCFMHNLNIDEINEKYKLDINILNKFLNDDENITVKDLIKIAEILNINIIELFKEDIAPSKTLKLK